MASEKLVAFSAPSPKNIPLFMTPEWLQSLLLGGPPITLSPELKMRLKCHPDKCLDLLKVCTLLTTFMIISTCLSHIIASQGV